MESTKEQAPVDEQPTTTAETENEQQQNGEDCASAGDQAAAEESVVEEGSLIKAGSEDEGKIFVGGLSWDTKTKGLRKYFSQFGEVKDCVIKEDNVLKKSRGFGFVLFKDPESVKEVLKQKEHRLDNRVIDPKKAKALKKEHKLFAGGFSPDITNDQLRAHFSAFGEIELLERPTEKPSEKPRGFCFITYKTAKSMNDACQEQYQEVEGKRCEVKVADPQRDKSGRGRQQTQYGGGYYQGGWAQQPWNQGHGGYGDFSGYGGYHAGYNLGQPAYGGQGGYGSYGNYQGYGNSRGYGFNQGNNMYPQGQQQTQPMMYGKNNYRRGQVNNFKSY